MSAWIVSKEHIDLIVSEGIRLEARLVSVGDDGALEVDRLTSLNANTVGRVLWGECQRSVAYRYPRDRDGQWPGPAGLTLAEIEGYTWTPTTLRLGMDRETQRLVGLINAIECYEYQSCEHPGWASSEAKRWVESIYRLAVARLTRRLEPNLPWGIDAEHVSKRVFAR